MLPYDQKIGIKGENPQLFLIIPPEILKAVHQDMLNIFVNANWHKTSETDLTMQLNTSLIFVAKQVWLSTPSSDTPDLSHVTVLPLTSEEYWLFTFLFQQLLSHMLLFLLFCTLANFAHFFFLLSFFLSLHQSDCKSHQATQAVWYFEVELKSNRQPLPYM